MKIRNYEEIDISGDVGLKIYGKNLPDLFVNAAYGLYSLITNADLLEPKRVLEIQSRGESLEGLMVAYLNDLIFHFDSHGFIGTHAKVNSIDEKNVRVTLHGEDFDEHKSERRLLLKAATYHNIHVEKTGDSWTAFVMFDI